MESEQMLPIYKKPLVKEKAKWKRSACLTFAGLTFLVTVVFGSILFFVNKNRNDEPLSINDDLNVSVSVDDDNFFSFNSLLNENSVNYKVYAEFDVNMSKDELERALWHPDDKLWPMYGQKFIKKSGIFDYHYKVVNATTMVYDYKVEMNSMIGPDSAVQRQTHTNHYSSDERLVRRMRFQTFEFPYSDTFELYQIWDINEEQQPHGQSYLRVWSGIDWIKPPMFMIKQFIEMDLESSQEKIEKYLRQVLPVIDPQ